MADIEDASVNGNGEPLGTTPPSPGPDEARPVFDASSDESPPPAAPIPEQSGLEWPAPVIPEPPLEPFPPGEPTPQVEPHLPLEPTPVPEIPAPLLPPITPQPPAEPAPAPWTPPEPVAQEPAVPPAEQPAPDADSGFADGLTGQLQALSQSAETDAGETAEVAGGSLDDIAPGTVAALDAEPAGEGAESETAVEGAAVEGAEAAKAADGAEGTETAAAEATEGTATATTAEGEDVGALGEVEGPRATVSWWPFVGYIMVWLGAAGYAVWQLQQLPAGQAAYETNFYTMAMLGGLALLAVGPVLLLIVWLASWIGRENRRIGLMFISALLKGALSTLIGAIIWIGALMLIDYLRLGRPF